MVMLHHLSNQILGTAEAMLWENYGEIVMFSTFPGPQNHLKMFILDHFGRKLMDWGGLMHIHGLVLFVF